METKMTTQIYFHMEAVKGIVTKKDASKLTPFAEYELINGVLEIPCSSKDKAREYLAKMNHSKLSKEYKASIKVHRFYRNPQGDVFEYVKFINL
jgi:hypothetical protein